MTGHSPLGSFACDAGTLQELMAGRTLACPCCDGPLTAEKLSRLLSDVQRLTALANDRPDHASTGVGRHAAMIIDPHAHMISRTTDDYEAMAKAGVVAMGELGYDEQTSLEDKALRKQIELAKEYLLPIMIHTPHRDKRAGTLRTMDVLKEHKFDPARCVIDHNNEETIREVLNRGYWCAFSIYPQTKMGSERMAALVESFGPDRLIVDSACDWGVSDPLAVAKTARLMAQRGVGADAIHQVIYSNALAVYGLNGEMDEQHWLAPAAIDQRTLYEGNSVLRGGQTPRIEQPGRPADDLRIV